MTLRQLLSLAYLLFLTSCASIRPPPGGDEDKSPPQLDTTIPAQGMTNVPRKTTLHFEFAQDIDRTSFGSAITITPYMSGVVKYDWSGYDEVDVILPDSLRENTTYVVTLSRDLKTLRGGTLGTPTQITFSTGNIIDSGIITGRVLPSFKSTEKSDLGGVFVFAYDISKRNTDTLNMSHTRPDYITQPDKDGNFTLRALADGNTYRIIGVVDEFRNRLYDHTIDDYAVATSDVKLDKPTVSNIWMRLARKFDTTKPVLQEIEVRDAYHFRAIFSEAIDSNAVNIEMYSLRSNDNNGIETMTSVFRENPEKKPNVITFETYAPLYKNKSYHFIIKPSLVSDMRGNFISDTTASITFTVPETTVDTFSLPKFIGASIPDSSFDVSRKLNILLRFTNPIAEGFEKGITVSDSSGKTFPFTLTRIDGVLFHLTTNDSLDNAKWYTLELRTSDARSPINGNITGYHDTTHRIRFKTTDNVETGNITGTVNFNDTLYDPANYRIVVDLLNIATGQQTRSVLPEGKKSFTLSTLPRGKYKVRAYLTAHPNNLFESGTVTPFQFSMPSGEYESEIDIRPRWSVDNVNFDLK
jgi:polyisoprenoid-binding protein YceI